jgi:hypothetical protein
MIGGMLGRLSTAILLLLAGVVAARAESEQRVTVKNAAFSTTVPASPGWRQVQSAYLSATYQWQDVEHLRSWNIMVAGIQIKPDKTREALEREFHDASKGLLQPGFEIGPIEFFSRKARRYECVEGGTLPSSTTALPMTLKFKVAICRHPLYANGAVLLAMSVGAKTGDDAELTGFDRLIDDLVMN